MERNLTCDELLTYLSDYIDRDLSEPLMEAAQRHLSTCQNCRVVLDTTQRTISLYRAQGQRTIPARRRQSLFDQLQSAFMRKPDES